MNLLKRENIPNASFLHPRREIRCHSVLIFPTSRFMSSSFANNNRQAFTSAAWCQTNLTTIAGDNTRKLQIYLQYKPTNWWSDLRIDLYKTKINEGIVELTKKKEACRFHLQYDIFSFREDIEQTGVVSGFLPLRFARCTILGEHSKSPFKVCYRYWSYHHSVWGLRTIQLWEERGTYKCRPVDFKREVHTAHSDHRIEKLSFSFGREDQLAHCRSKLKSRHRV